MQPKESLIAPGSEYYVYTPSAQAQGLFLYPLIVGRFQYLPGYCLRRTALDSFLIMHVTRGGCEVECNGRHFSVREGQAVILDCYASHAYSTTDGWEAEWLHFDGVCARGYYDALLAVGSPVITLKNSCRFENCFHEIYTKFQHSVPVQEAVLNSLIVSLLTELMVEREPAAPAQSVGVIEDSVAYINKHLTRELSLEELAGQASLSPFYFSRLFKRETGFSPHQYIIAARINNAKFLLRSTDEPVKSVGFSVGFTSESSFCTAFKKETGRTPSEYRLQAWRA